MRMQVVQLLPSAAGTALQFGLEAIAAGGMRSETLLTLAAGALLLAVGAALLAGLLRLVRARRAPRTFVQAAAGRDKRTVENLAVDGRDGNDSITVDGAVNAAGNVPLRPKRSQ